MITTLTETAVAMTTVEEATELISKAGALGGPRVLDRNDPSTC